jgi:hypothetical protein
MKTKTKHSAYKQQATRTSKQQATRLSNKQQAKEKKGGTRPQARTMVRGAMSH